MVILAIVLLFILAVGLYGLNAKRTHFRRMLPGEITEWIVEGIIDENQAKRLREKYRLDSLTEESQTTLIKTIFGFGAVLIAMGVVAFIAANWEAIPKGGKLLLVTVAMLLFHGSGFWLWKIRKSNYLGQVLILLGSLVFGANIILTAQMFHIQGNFYQGFLIFSMGVLVMGYAVSSLPHFILAVIAAFVWYCGWFFDNPQGFPIFIPVILPLFLPFVYQKQSRSIHFLTLLAWGAGVLLYLSPFERENSVFFLIVGTVFLSILYWSYGDWPFVGKNKDFSDDSKILGILALSISAYLLSFHTLIQEVIDKKLILEGSYKSGVLFLVVILAIIFSFLSLHKNKAEHHQKASLGILVFSGFLLIVVPLLSGVWADLLGTVLANLSVVLIGGLLFWRGLTELDRRYFWLGLFLLVLEVIGRFFEYETGLLLKSLAFIIAGLILISGGVFFEKRRGTVLNHEN